MPHDELSVGQIPSADRLQRLDTQGTYTPTLTATTTNPNLGADGEITGFWHRNGHRISGRVFFLFSGAGLSAGSGIFEISLPFDADLSIEIASGSVGVASQIGTGFLRDNSTSANSSAVFPRLFSANTFLMNRPTSNAAVTEALPVPWAEGDRGSIQFAYLADPAGLP